MSASPPKNIPSGFRLSKPMNSQSLRGLRTWAAAMRARLAPSARVLVIHPDGTQSVWTRDAIVPVSDSAKRPGFVAVEIPDEFLLRRSLVMPPMSHALALDALLLEVRSNSPFEPEDLAWGMVARAAEGGNRRAELVIASRRQIAQFIGSRWPELGTGQNQPEAWAVAGLPAPVVLAGFGEQRRLLHAARWRRWNWALLAAGGALALLAAATPTAQLRLRAVEAVASYEALSARTAPLVRKRDELAMLSDRLRSLDGVVADRVDPAEVIEYLTRVLPDDTFLYNLEIQKRKITASGHTVDAAALLQKLSLDSRLRGVRSPGAVVRQPGATKEAFTVEFTMDTMQAPVVPPGAGAAAASPRMAAAPVATASAVKSPVAILVPPPALLAPTVAPGAAGPPPASVKPNASPFVIGGSR